MKKLKKGSKAPHNGVFLTNKEWKDILTEKQILDEIEQQILKT